MKRFNRRKMIISFFAVFLLSFYFLILSVFGQEKTIKEDALNVIFSRKSVRTFIPDKPVTKEQLELLMKAAMAAPTAMDKRPWVFVAVTKRENLDKLAEGLRYAQMLKQASAAIFVCGDTTKTTGEFWKMDCSAATENLLLAVEATGLGAVWTAVYPDSVKINHVRDILGLPQTVIPLNCIPIGYPTGTEKPKDKWNPANIHWERW